MDCCLLSGNAKEFLTPVIQDSICAQMGEWCQSSNVIIGFSCPPTTSCSSSALIQTVSNVSLAETRPTLLNVSVNAANAPSLPNDGRQTDTSVATQVHENYDGDYVDPRIGTEIKLY